MNGPSSFRNGLSGPFTSDNQGNALRLCFALLTECKNRVLLRNFQRHGTSRGPEFVLTRVAQHVGPRRTRMWGRALFFCEMGHTTSRTEEEQELKSAKRRLFKGERVYVSFVTTIWLTRESSFYASCLLLCSPLYLSACLSVVLVSRACQPVCQSASLLVCPFVHLLFCSSCLSAHRLIGLAARRLVSLSLSLYLCLFLSLSLCPLLLYMLLCACLSARQLGLSCWYGVRLLSK